MKKTEGTIEKLLKDKAGIKLNIGSGDVVMPGFVNLDMRPLPNVDIVHDIEISPWPLPDECVLTAVASHVLEHINPHKGIFMNVMDEVWRVLKPDGQFAFVVPYAESHGFFQDPTHCNPINETTMHYFDPLSPTGLYSFYKPKPWKIEFQAMDRQGVLDGQQRLARAREAREDHEVLVRKVVQASVEAIDQGRRKDAAQPGDTGLDLPRVEGRGHALHQRPDTIFRGPDFQFVDAIAADQAAEITDELSRQQAAPRRDSRRPDRELDAIDPRQSNRVQIHASQ